MEAFRQLTSLFMSPECFEKIFFELDLLNVPCLKMIVSRGLGYGILLGSMFLRVPQILKLLSAKSGKGISVVSEILALVAIFGTLAYGYLKRFPMAAYGDMYFLYLQGIIILLMVLFYEKKTCSIVISAGTFALVTVLLFTDRIPEQFIVTLNSVSVILSVVSKLNQAYMNFANGSTGALSAITLILAFAGTSARIFTSIQETGDMTLIVASVLNSLANGILVLQLAYYWNSDSDKTKSPVKAKKTDAKKVKKTN